MKILFVGEKWCDANPKCGITCMYQTIYGSLINSGLADLDILHLDECQYTQNKHIDQIIREYLKTHEEPAMIGFTYLGGSPMNPTLDIIKEIAHIPLVFVWNDTVWPYARNLITETEEYAKVIWVMDGNMEFPCRYPEKIFYNGVPQDERIFHPDEQNIPVSFVGNYHGYKLRPLYLQYLQEQGIPITIRGGQRSDCLTPEDYASIIRSSKISINFCESPSGFDQCKSRVTEVLACSSFLLEQDGAITATLFKPDRDYITFNNPEDLKQKIEYYLNNEDERKKIADQGHATYISNNSNTIYWQKLLERLYV